MRWIISAPDGILIWKSLFRITGMNVVRRAIADTVWTRVRLEVRATKKVMKRIRRIRFVIIRWTAFGFCMGFVGGGC